MIFLDQESSDVKCIVACWLKQAEEVQLRLQAWMDGYFFKA